MLTPDSSFLSLYPYGGSLTTFYLVLMAMIGTTVTTEAIMASSNFGTGFAEQTQNTANGCEESQPLHSPTIDRHLYNRKHNSKHTQSNED
jgi:hypothetical protein